MYRCMMSICIYDVQMYRCVYTHRKKQRERDTHTHHRKDARPKILFKLTEGVPPMLQPASPVRVRGPGLCLHPICVYVHTVCMSMICIIHMYVCMYVHIYCVLPCRILRPRRCVCFVFLRPKNICFRNKDMFIITSSSLCLLRVFTS